MARFIDRYGANYWQNPHWPTRDRIIPFHRFYAMVACIPHMEVVHQLHAYHASLLAGAAVHGGEEGRGARERHIESLIADGYPEVAEHGEGRP